MKGCITTFVVRKMQIKISMRNYFTLSCLANIKNPTRSSVVQGGEQEGLSYMANGEWKGHTYFRKCDSTNEQRSTSTFPTT